MSKPVQYILNPSQQALCLARMTGFSSTHSQGGVLLWDVDMRFTDFRGADLRSLALSNVDLYGSDLSYANLRGATLVDVSLDYVILHGADLRFAKQGTSNPVAPVVQTFYATPLVCALAKVGAPGEVIHCRWDQFQDCDSVECDHWASLAKLYMLGQEDD